MLLGRQPDQQQRLIHAQFPEEPEEISRLIDETLFQGMADIDRRPEFWKPYSAGIAAIKATAIPGSQRRRMAHQRAILSRLINDADT